MFSLLHIHYIYIQRLHNNKKLKLFDYMSQLKNAMEIEYKIYKSQKNLKQIAKYKFVHDNL